MSIQYKTLTQDEKDDVIVSFLHQQEIDHYCHSINKERYEKLLSDNKLPEGTFKENIQNLMKELESRITEVERIIENTKSQLPSQERIESAIVRMNEKNKELTRKS
ncbi:MAG: hypothetical protein PHP08_00270 [Candidatus Dojkabacteria bacterium]|nr:hypothetical protein [Candidatus Dojkabacteria bacterium]